MIAKNDNYRSNIPIDMYYQYTLVMLTSASHFISWHNWSVIRDYGATIGSCSNHVSLGEGCTIPFYETHWTIFSTVIGHASVLTTLSPIINCFRVDQKVQFCFVNLNTRLVFRKLFHSWSETWSMNTVAEASMQAGIRCCWCSIALTWKWEHFWTAGFGNIHSHEIQGVILK